MASGCIVPIRCIISIGVVEETALTVPLLPVSDMELMFMEKASIQSDGESLIFTWTAVLAVGVGVGLELVDVPPPPQAVKTLAKTKAALAAVIPRHEAG